MLIATRINKHFGTRQALQDVSFEIGDSEIVSLLGPSGCGKTTLLRMLSLVELPDSGHLQIDEFKFSFPGELEKPDGLYPRINMVFQQFQLWAHLTVRRNILLPIEDQENFERDGYEEAVDYFGLRELLDRFPYQISVGQKQRVALVRAVLTKPKYLLLDEITSSLDIEYIERLKKYLLGLKGAGVSIVLTTHLIGFAQTVSDRVYFITDGQIVEKGTPEILSNPKSTRLRQFLSLA